MGTSSTTSVYLKDNRAFSMRLFLVYNSQTVDKTIRIKVLGAFEAQFPKQKPLDLSTKKAQALLAFLAVEETRSHPREKLAGLLWGDVSDERARHNLRQVLSKIRSTCGEIIISRGDSLCMDLEGCSIDVHKFQKLANSDIPEKLQQCLELYRGDLLDGQFPRERLYEEWLLGARDRLRRAACAACDRLVSILITQNRLDEAINALNHRLTMDPACEPAHRDLMEILVRQGRRSDALRQFQTCSEALERELGVNPDDKTCAVYEKIRQSESLDTSQPVEEVAPKTPIAAERDRPAVAVLAFDNLSHTEDRYFVDGIAEDIITALSRFDTLIVIARGSSFVYRDRDLPDKQIANELGAQYLVRGSVQRAGNRVRINIQLLDALENAHVWGQRFDREMEDVFVLQDEITATVVSTLAGRLEAARLAQARRAPPERLEAYDFVLRGKDHHHRYSPEDCQIAVDMFNKAIERDPSYALAFAWLACCLGQAIVFQLDKTLSLVNRAEAAAKRGLELDEDEAESHRILAQVNLSKRNLKQSLWHQERALFLNPNDDRSVCSMGEILAFVGKHKEAQGWVQKSMRLNPYHPQRYWSHLARPQYHLGEFDAVLSTLDHIQQLRIDDHTYRVAANVRLNNAELAESNVQDLREAFPDYSAKAFIASQPYQRDADRQSLLEALLQTSLKDNR